MRAVLLVVLAAGCAATPAPRAAISVRSPDFGPGASIPEVHTCDGADRSPALSFVGVPAGARGLVLIVDDPDAPGGVFTHWLVWGLAVDAAFPSGAAPAGAVEGTSDFGRPGWGGPCPPRGPAHRYRFRALAVDAALALPPGADRAALDAALAGHILAEGVLVGTYARRQ